MELSDLAQIQFGARRAWRPLDRYRPVDSPAATPSADPAEHTVITLRQLLELTTGASRPIGLAIETKHPSRYGGAVEAKLVAMLDEFGLRNNPRATPPGSFGAQIGVRPAVRVMSFAFSSLRRMRRLAPDLDLVLLMGRVPVHLRDGSLPEGVRAAGVDVRVIRRHPEYVTKAHAQGNAVYVWTVNSFADADACLAAGVDALITDRPLSMRAHVYGSRTAGSA
jgi:glycerophosphoryl diester phosphodiesterase